ETELMNGWYLNVEEPLRDESRAAERSRLVIGSAILRSFRNRLLVVMAAMSALLPLLMPGAASFAGGGSYHPAGPSGASEAWTEPGPATKQAGAVNWKLEKTTGEKPAPRGAGKWIPVGNKIVAIGGFYECFDKTKCDHTYYDDVFT